MQAIQTALAILAAIRQLLPAIVSLVQDIEAALPQPGQGQAKLAMARTILSTAVGDMQNIGVAFDALWPALSAVIATEVAISKAGRALACSNGG
jgi:hypothetical protein